MRTIVFLDLDSTYWTWGRVPNSARRAVGEAQANGHLVIANTSRTRGGLVGCWPDEFDGVCCANGMDVTLRGETLVFETLGAPRAKKALRAIEAGRSLVMVEGTERVFVLSRVPGVVGAARWFARRNMGEGFVLGNVRDMDEGDFSRVQKLGVTFFGGVSPTFVAGLDVPEGMVARASGSSVELTDARFSKVSAMEAALARLGGSWRTVAFGDSAGDSEMLRAADVGVAMGNAKSAVKQVADLVTDDINRDGLLHAFEQLGLV